MDTNDKTDPKALARFLGVQRANIIGVRLASFNEGRSDQEISETLHGQIFVEGYRQRRAVQSRLNNTLLGFEPPDQAVDTKRYLSTCVRRLGYDLSRHPPITTVRGWACGVLQIDLHRIWWSVDGAYCFERLDYGGDRDIGSVVPSTIRHGRLNVHERCWVGIATDQIPWQEQFIWSSTFINRWGLGGYLNDLEARALYWGPKV